MKLSVEVIIPTLNRPDCIEKLIDSILIQSVKPYKITIIDAGSKFIDYERYKNIFTSLGIRFIVFKTRASLTHQRNKGIQYIDCDIFVFSDDDVVFESFYFKNLAKVFEDDKNKTIGGATGKMLNFKNRTTALSSVFRKLFYLSRVSDGSLLPSGFGLSLDYANHQLRGIGWLSGCNMAYRHDVFESLWFDENLVRYGYMEDLDFSVRVSKKYQLVYIPEACYEHHQAPQERLKDADRYAMLMRNHHYLFKKNFAHVVKSKFPHYLSLLGIPIQALLLQRSIRGFIGACKGLFEIVFMGNYKLPNYLERLDHSMPSMTQIAEHEVRYKYAATFCSDKIVLDCALGEGIGANILCETAKKVFGVDLDEMALQSAKRNIQHSNIEYISASALSLPFSDNYFDIVTSIETLEHIPDRYHNLVIAEFKRVLKPNGKLILSTPNKIRTSPGKIAPCNYFHLKELTFNELKQLFENHFDMISWTGLYNPVREGSMKLIKQKAQKEWEVNIETKRPLRKKILLLMPFWLKDMISLQVNGIHIYPSISEYQLIEKEAEFSNDLVFIGTKNI